MVGAVRIERWGAVVVLALLVLVSYAPSLSAGFLDYDDRWLIELNDHLTAPLMRALPAILFDLSHQTRLDLGAEYLPVRDLFLWCEVHMLGVDGPALHRVSVALYLGALLILRATALRTWGHKVWVELAVIAFALHPVHAESVGWLSGQKDLLALLFIVSALYLHAGSSRYGRYGVPFLVLLAMLSKSMSISVLIFLAAHDLLVERRPDWRRYLCSVAVAAATTAVHMQVGGVVHMYGPPAGGSHLTALMTMSPVVQRYLGASFLPAQLSIRYDVPDRLHWDLPSVAGVSLVVALASSACWAFRRGSRLPAWAFLWFFGALLPVCQLWLQLENRMADRYLCLAVWAPCVCLAWLIGHAYQRSRIPAGALAVGWCTALFVLTLQRSVLFSDNVLLFTDALTKTARDTHSPYMLGRAFEQRRQEALAISAYRTASERIPTTEVAPPGDRLVIVRAEEALARLLAKHGRIDEANAVLLRLASRSANAGAPEPPAMRAPAKTR